MQTETPPAADFAAVIAAIRREYEVLAHWLGALDRARWHGPTACTEWPLQKLVSHLGSGAEIHLLNILQYLEDGEPATREVNQRIWDHFDSLAPEPLYAAFRDRNERYVAYGENLPADRHHARVKSFAGEVPVGTYAQFRLGELTLHSWDARVALDPTARLLPSTVRVHWPQARTTFTRRANAEARGALAGTTYHFLLFGPVADEFTLSVGADALTLDADTAAAPTASLRLPAEAFLRLVTGRLPLATAEAEGEVLIEGDHAAAVRLNALFPGW
jgi:uncharacterized protein (TIGR03083 family)